MNNRYLMFFVVTIFAFGSCSDDYMLYSDKNRVQFKNSTEENFSFVYSESSKMKDTIFVDIMTIGDVVNYDRQFKIEQITKEWKKIYDTTDPKLVVDSIYTDMDFPAIEGVHFQPIGNNWMATVPAGSNGLRLNIVVLRDKSLSSNSYKLTLNLLQSSDFDLGEKNKLSKTLNISNVLSRPTRWKDNSYYYKMYLGNWSARKHRLLIDVTGQKWDDPFLLYIVNNADTRSLRDYYLAKAKKALAEYNSDPANNPPMLDENNNKVVFP